MRLIFLMSTSSCFQPLFKFFHFSFFFFSFFPPSFFLSLILPVFSPFFFPSFFIILHTTSPFSPFILFSLSFHIISFDPSPLFPPSPVFFRLQQKKQNKTMKAIQKERKQSSNLSKQSTPIHQHHRDNQGDKEQKSIDFFRSDQKLLKGRMREGRSQDNQR